MIPQGFFRAMLEAEMRRPWRLALCTAHQGEFFDAAREVVGEGYTSGGRSLPPPEIEQDGRKLRVRWTSPVVFPAVTVTAHYCAIYDPATRRVAVSLDFGQDVRAENGPFTVTLPTDAFQVRV